VSVTFLENLREVGVIIEIIKEVNV